MRSGLAMALVAHALLIVALAWSVNWKASEPEGVVAELWSSLPQTAAPRAAPEPKPAPVVEPKPPPPPEPTVQAKPPPIVKPEPAPPPRADAQIAIERAAREQARRQEAEREAAKQAELRKREEAKRIEAKRIEAERERVAQEQAEKRKLAEQAKKDEARQAAIREANLRRLMAQAGSSDDPAAATGNAARTSGPSAGYAGRIKARVRPNIVLTATIAGNPAATVEVRVAPDGTIVSRKLVTSSGATAWDETVLRAIDKTEVLPKDIDGRVPPTIIITFRPND
jgi:colicin import membrane protein